MFTLTNEDDPYYVHFQCGCGRMFRAEEMYICYNCNKIMCRFCLTEEIEYCYCKNYCKRNQSVTVTQAKKMKNSCDQCLECPLCFVALVKRQYNGKYLYVCPHCYWDTSNIKFSCTKESDLDSLIFQLKDSSVKGFLKKMYDHCTTKLKENDGLITEIPVHNRMSSIRGSVFLEENSNLILQAMETKLWDFDNICNKLTEEDEKIENKSILKYDDNYFQQHNSYCAFNAVANFLSCSLDFSDKYSMKSDSIESLKEKIKTDLDPNFVSSVEQRLNNLTFQHPFTGVLFPKFVDLVSKKSKRCKACKKFIVQAEDSSKKPGQKLELCHLFLNQFPFCFIHKIDPSNNTLLLKFQLCDYKETKISFEECESSPHKVLLPPGNYTVSEGNETIGEYVTGKSDKWIILNFKWETNPSFKEMLQDKENFIILRFRIHAEYVRLVEESKLSYVTEIKFKFN